MARRAGNSMVQELEQKHSWGQGSRSNAVSHFIPIFLSSQPRHTTSPSRPRRPLTPANIHSLLTRRTFRWVTSWLGRCPRWSSSPASHTAAWTASRPVALNTSHKQPAVSREIAQLRRNRNAKTTQRRQWRHNSNIFVYYKLTKRNSTIEKRKVSILIALFL